MEDDDNETGGNLLLIALAVLGIALGGAALYFGLTANQRLTPLTASLEAESSAAARIEATIGELQSRLDELSAQVSDTTSGLSRLRAYGTQSEQALKRLASEVTANREQILKTAEKLNEFAASGFRPPADRSAASSGGSVDSEADGGGDAAKPRTAGPGAADDGSGSAPESTYTIKSGDTFQRVATARGIGLQALLDANPDVDPRRLRIGQEINLPAN